MKWSYRIARIRGIDVRIHLTFLLLPVFFGFGAWKESGWAGAVGEVSFLLALFLCVLLHEFGHALAGRRYGIRTPDITLLPIGGVARMENIPEKPSMELFIAIAGPAVNVAICIVLTAILMLTGGFLQGPETTLRLMLHNLLLMNAGLVFFNMIPAFPMDGGRVLRALLAMKFSHLGATRAAARTGQAMALVFAVAGFLGNPMLLLIAMFVFNGAQQELQYAIQRDQYDQMLRAIAAGHARKTRCDFTFRGDCEMRSFRADSAPV
jgi:stage IV sporulation protein FB